MMTELQLSEIRHYLLSKKLPIDILLEVQDHFVSQIQDVIKDTNTSFETAFEKTKENWARDLKLSWNGSMDLEDSTPFMRTMRRKIEWSNARKALKYTTIHILIIFLSAFFMNAKAFEVSVSITVSAPFFYALYQYIRHYKTMELWRKYPNHILTLHQTSMFLFFSFFAAWMNFLRMFFEASEKLQQTLQFQNSQYSISELLLLFALLLFLISGMWFSIISQKKYLEQIEKVKPFLKYLS
ncbi:hypothetical protein AAH994_03670 [Weeksellaceae bacterium A-14]